MSEKEIKKPVVADDKKRITDLENGLIWIRDNVVHGNEKHVEKINQILKGDN